MQIRDVVYVYRLIGGERLAWHGRYHAHEAGEYEFHYFMEGQGAILINRSRYSINGNIIYYVKPREFHSILPEAVEKPISYYAVLFSPESENPTDNEVLSLLQQSWQAPNHSLPANTRDRFLLEDLYMLSRSKVPGSKRTAEYALISLLYRWSAGFVPSNVSGAPEQSKNEHVERALSYMSKHVREKLSSDDLADAMGLSEEYFIRLFRQHLGMSPFQYFTRLKIEAASAVLVDNHLTISDVATRFGFENPFHFTKVFKKCTGLSPRDYRKVFFEAGKPSDESRPNAKMS